MNKNYNDICVISAKLTVTDLSLSKLGLFLKKNNDYSSIHR